VDFKLISVLLAKIKYYCLVDLFFFAVCFSCNPAKKVKDQSRQLNKMTEDSAIIIQRQLLKEFALCNCLRFGYPNSDIYTDISISIYFNQLLYGQSIINKITEISKQEVETVKPLENFDYKGKKPIFLSCMEFYKSNRLDSIVRASDSSILK
jgi:hypothetical protein